MPSPTIPFSVLSVNIRDMHDTATQIAVALSREVDMAPKTVAMRAYQIAEQLLVQRAVYMKHLEAEFPESFADSPQAEAAFDKWVQEEVDRRRGK